MYFVSGSLMAFTWGVSLAAGILATLLLRPSRKGIAIILGTLFANGLLFVGAHLLKLSFGPLIELDGNVTPVAVDIVFALIGAVIGVLIAKAFKAR